MSRSITELWNGSKYNRSNENNTIACCVCEEKTVVYWRYKSFLFLFSVRSMKLSTVRLLIANSADPNIVNNRGETAVAIAEHLQSDQQQNFINALAGKYN